VILVDTSVWIDHLHQAEPSLATALAEGQVGTHPLVEEELAAGRLAGRQQFLALLERLVAMPVLSHREFLAFTQTQHLWGRGLGPVDIHLLGSARIAAALLWTRDQRLAAAAADLGVRLF
jgi:predicted nucleic acid-binding protein